MWAGAQLHLIPLALLIAALIYPFVGHFQVVQTSPVFATKQATDRWLADKARAYRCMPASTHTEAIAEFSTVDSPWYGKLKCSQNRISFKFAKLFAVAWVALNLFVLLMTRRTPRKD
jgi:hypothetical protein